MTCEDLHYLDTLYGDYQSAHRCYIRPSPPLHEYVRRVIDTAPQTTTFAPSSMYSQPPAPNRSHLAAGYSTATHSRILLHAILTIVADSEALPAEDDYKEEMKSVYARHQPLPA